MNIKTTISLEEKEQMVVGVQILSWFDGIELSRNALKTVIENVLCWLDIEDEEDKEEKKKRIRKMKSTMKGWKD